MIETFVNCYILYRKFAKYYIHLKLYLRSYTKAHNAAKASESAFCQQATMIPGSPMYIELQQLSKAHLAPCDKETTFLKEVVNIGRITDIPISELWLASTGKKHYYMSIRSVASYILEKCPSKLLAGYAHPDDSGFKNLLAMWWKAYRALHPQHDVFTRYGDELHSVIPMKLHSDEGTGQRKAPVMQYSWGPMLTAAPSSLDRYYYYTSCVGEDYKRFHAGYAAGNPVLDEFHTQLAADCRDVFLEGLFSEKLQKKLRFCFVGLEGDLPAQARAFRVVRNFGCVPHRCCPWCWADDTTTPYTDRRPEARWRGTISRDVPWDTNNPSPLVTIPGADRVMFLSKDLFHMAHLGHVRTFCVNLLCYLVWRNHFATRRYNSFFCSSCFSPDIFFAKFRPFFKSRNIKDGSSIPSRLASAYSSFRDWCKRSKEYPHVKAFTRENLQWPSLHSHPEASFKGSDTRLIMKFLIEYMSTAQLDNVGRAAIVAIQGMDDFLRLVFGQKDERGCKAHMWDRSEAANALADLTKYLDGSYECALACYRLRACFFTMTPKNHYLHHIAVDLDVQLQAGLAWIINPGLWATQMAEDSTGRNCRIARNCHVLGTSLRLAQRWLISTHLFWSEESA